MPAYYRWGDAPGSVRRQRSTCVSGTRVVVSFEHELRCRPVRGSDGVLDTTGPRKGAGTMTVLHIAHPSLDERAEHGREAREHTPLDSHTGWRPATDRPDPVALL